MPSTELHQPLAHGLVRVVEVGCGIGPHLLKAIHQLGLRGSLQRHPPSPAPKGAQCGWPWQATAGSGIDCLHTPLVALRFDSLLGSAASDPLRYTASSRQ